MWTCDNYKCSNLKCAILLLVQTGISHKIALRVTPRPQIHVNERFHAVRSLKILKVYMYFAGHYKFWLLSMALSEIQYKFSWGMFIESLLISINRFALMEYFLLYGVMGWLEASTSLVYSDHNQFWCWMQEIVLPAQTILFFITYLHACVNLQVNCFLLHYKKIY